ncbi:MAG: hypothetical protein ACK53L_33220, partial [Pirellulaceae bacterium]
VLALAVEKPLSLELGLSDEQLEALKKLIADREAEALDIAAKERELPPADRQARRRELVRELEQRGYGQLTIEQRSRLERIRLSQLGLTSLSEPEVAETLGLSPGQLEQVQQVMGGRGE